MKKIMLFCWIFQCALMAQDTTSQSVKDTSFKFSGFFGVDASQTSLSNWQGGGQNNAAIGSIFNAEIIYQKKKEFLWSNKIDVQYRLVRPGEGVKFRKNNDLLFAFTKLNKSAFSKYWFYSFQSDYRSQIAPGYKFRGDTIDGPAVSDINSPGYIQAAFGFDYKRANYFSVNLAPLAVKLTLVNRQYLADAGEFGVKKAVRDAQGNILKKGKKTRYEFGGRVVVKYKKDLNKYLNIDSYLDLFSNYLEGFGNVDIVFNNLLTFKINKFLTFNIISQMMYDNDVIIKRDWNKDGRFDSPGDINGPRLQALTTVAAGFGYKF